MSPMDPADRRASVRRRPRTAAVVTAVAAVAAALCAVTACGGGHPYDRGGRPHASGPATGPAVPPGSFPETPTTTFQGAWPALTAEDGPSGVLTLGTRLAYAYDRDDVGVTAFHLDSGEVAWHSAVPGGDDVAQAPRLTGDKVIGAFTTTEEGGGTYADRRALTVVALEAGTGATLWTREIALGTAGGAGGDGEDPDPTAVARVVGADDRHVLVASDAPGYSETPPLSALLDTATGRVVWTDTDFEGVDLERSVAVGVRDDGDFVGRSTTDGAQLWKRDLRLGEARTADPGPGLTWADGVGPGGSLLLDPTSGTTRLDSGDTSLDACRYDGGSITVCAGSDGSGDASVWAVDVRDARVLWRLPDRPAGRIAPEVTAAWHGVVYAQADQAMTLDARTGRDLDPDVGLVSPALVNDGYGLVYDATARAFDVYRSGGAPGRSTG
ncbi:outer membrane protein assembly factor BamB family protein [Streptomyces albireticuli]|nr:PQQ-binding-like beta-propeller repeat protein [Streptomyces albireticuli]MCD9143750.1 PQQ-binding-like beta-propeller repeat protein [Streptomyces albireticuli]MCD9161819.1 PQQ-binding-like beta-propeller repeat protein [Streptomyces albireticuli]MCD9191867.1 PQQ-binding-like beta-propeller repeat protein [Streptomyces albireticuli]